MTDAAHGDSEKAHIPSKGDRIELVTTQMGVRLRGTVYYSDQLQILVKWDSGRSQSLRTGIDRFRIIDSATDKGTPASADNQEE
jgi:hypothetical protein